MDPDVAFTVNWVVAGCVVTGELGAVAAAGEVLEQPIIPKLTTAAAAINRAPLSKDRRFRMPAKPSRPSGARNASA